MIDLAHTAPTVHPVVGGVYKDRRGEQHGPMKMINYVSAIHPSPRLWLFKANKHTWKADGCWNMGSLPTDFDLITVISEPTEKPAVSKKVVSVDIYVTEEDGTEKIYNLDHKDGIIGLYCETYGVDMTPDAARAIAEEMLKMVGNKV
jgi:hypothetical protein